MGELRKETYDDFYVAYFNERGNVIYPTDVEENKKIREMLKNITSDNFVFIKEKKLCYKVRIKRKIVDGVKIQMVELSNVTEFIKQVSTASIDEITHLNNRKIARNLFAQHIERAYMRNESFSIILADLDNFKAVNDTYGHINGDIVLSEVSRILFCKTRHERGRDEDIVARIGGDEFVVILKNISKDEAYKKAEILRSEVERHKVALFSENSDSKYIGIGTLSVGVYHINVEELNKFYENGYTTEEIRTVIFDRCDSALYKSKNSGKNRVTAFEKEKTLTIK